MQLIFCVLFVSCKVYQICLLVLTVFLVEFSGFPIYTMSSINRNSFMSSFLIWIPLFLFLPNCSGKDFKYYVEYMW